jgi:hypothetical protein
VCVCVFCVKHIIGLYVGLMFLFENG